MSNRQQILNRLLDDGLVAVIRMTDTTHLLRAVEAIVAGGVTCIEITMTTPGALDCIARLSREGGTDILVGAGSVTSADAARAAVSAGAQFIVGPVFKEEILQIALESERVHIPGAFTPTEILRAWEAGADVVKVFPANVLGPGFLKDIKGPLPHVRLTPTGGIDMNNAAAFIKAGADFLGAGGSLLDKEAIRQQDWKRLTKHADRFLSIIRKARTEIASEEKDETEQHIEKEGG